MEKVFTKELRSTSTCKNCRVEMPKQSVICTECGSKNTYPEFVAALIIGGLGAMALYALYHF
jgi:hypothetical protein